MKYFITFFFLLFLILIIRCKKDEPEKDLFRPGTPDTPITDYDGNIYKAVKIGNQVWMAENLKTKFTSDGTAVVEAYVYYDDENYLDDYGRLYTREAAKKPFIDGWHLPGDAEWKILAITLGSDLAVKLKVGGSSGFEGKIGGYRTYTGQYVEMDSCGGFWTSPVYTSDHSYIRYLFAFNNDFKNNEGCGNIGGNSARLIKN